MQLSLLQRGTPVVSGGRMRTTTCSSGALSGSSALRTCCILQVTHQPAQSKGYSDTLLCMQA